LNHLPRAAASVSVDLVEHASVGRSTKLGPFGMQSLVGAGGMGVTFLIVGDIVTDPAPDYLGEAM